MKLQLFYPFRPYRVYQNFGDNQACCENNQLPITKRKIVSKVNGVCPSGYIELYPLLGMKGHTGTDLYAPHGSILRAPIDGVIEEIQTEPERGLGVGIVSNEKFLMGQYGEHLVKVRQWHLMSISVKLGQQVKVGDPVGLADTTGLSSGDHNHFEIKPVERNANGMVYNVYQDNGYYGAIDSAPYWSNFYAEDKVKVVGLYQSLISVLKQIIALLKNK